MKKPYKGFWLMHNRSSTPDILGSLMTGVQKQATPKASLLVEEELKEKATFNLPVALLTELEDTCYEIRKLCRTKQISKTLIVEEALKRVFSEFKEKKEESYLFEVLKKHLK